MFWRSSEEPLVRQDYSGPKGTIYSPERSTYEYNTLINMNQQGVTLYEQKKYSEAEEMFRQVIFRCDQVFGRDHRDAFIAKHWLGMVLFDQKKYSEAETMLRQAVYECEQAHGHNHESALNCRDSLGRVLLEQKKYNEAEAVLRLAVYWRERTLGQYNESTINSRDWLAIGLYWQKKYSKAEEVLRQTMNRREQTLGHNDNSTLCCKYWLGKALFGQKKYSEAEEMLRQDVNGCEQTFGHDHENTLKGKSWLGRALLEQKKYSEAEEALRHVVNVHEPIPGNHHESTNNNMLWLAKALCWQKKYSEAEEVLRQAVHEHDQKHGQDHENALDDKQLLGEVLYWQKQYSEAEKVLRQTVHGQERTLGPNHESTLSSKKWLEKTLSEQKKYERAEEVYQMEALDQSHDVKQDYEGSFSHKDQLGVTIYAQKKYNEAEVLRQAVRGHLRTLRQDHKGTRFLDTSQLDSSPSMTGNTTQQALFDRLSSFFANNRDSQEPYTDADIIEILALLSRSNRRWSKSPRTYIILRTIGYLNLFDKLIDDGFSDYWLPVTERSLPDCLLPAVRSSFAKAQNLVLTKSMDLEKGERGQHCFYKLGESPPFETKGVLGTGGFGQVDRVLSLISFKEYARKRVCRALTYRQRRTADVKMFIAEIEILKRLKHHHIVELIGSYTDSRYIALIMSPVAEMDLSTYLASASNHPELRTFLGCLATALEFLHEHKIRHKDIKPSNILVDRGNIFLTDFGLSFDFTESGASTTTSIVNGMSPRYCSPEVAQFQPRNTMSDIWSLGVVFMEIIVVLKGKTTQEMDEFLRQHGSHETFIRTNIVGLLEFATELEEIGNKSDNRALGWTRRMLSAEPRLRPTASSLVASIIAAHQEEGSLSFCGICCISSEEEFSDYADD
jgi:TolA-binding protein